MNVAILTAAVGGQLRLYDPPLVFKNVHYYAFVDRIFDNIKYWRQLEVIEFSNDEVYKNRRNAKIYKILPEFFIPGYEYYIWIDSTHAIIRNPANVISKYLRDTDIAVFKHSLRDCIYEEAEIIKKYSFDSVEIVNKQIEHYLESCYPKNNGLYELSAFIRRNTKKISKFNLMWWEQICKYSSRDQLSFPYVLRQCNIIPNIIPGRINDPDAYKGIIPVTNNIIQQLHFSFHKRIGL